MNRVTIDATIEAAVGQVSATLILKINGYLWCLADQQVQDLHNALTSGQPEHFVTPPHGDCMFVTVLPDDEEGEEGGVSIYPHMRDNSRQEAKLTAKGRQQLVEMCAAALSNWTE
ncbi:MAG: hypothetical protein JNJ61_25705 [Anaerolineae bacterium]|nr:hypothetical protein [Anaerolineae bacterium]